MAVGNWHNEVSGCALAWAMHEQMASLKARTRSYHMLARSCLWPRESPHVLQPLGVTMRGNMNGTAQRTGTPGHTTISHARRARRAMRRRPPQRLLGISSS